MSLRKALLMGATACMGVQFVGMVSAQTVVATSNTTTLQTVVVTAERHASTVQKTAASISVRNGEQLKAEGKFSLSDILEDVPGVTAVPTSLALTQTDQPGANIVIRGVQPDNGAIGNTTIPTTAIYTDGVYSGIGGDYDVANYQVLRGPQGTLYGRSATSGVVAITTNDPVLHKYAGEASVEVGNYSLLHATAVLNVPIADSLAVRFAGNEYQTNGYVSAKGGRNTLTEGKMKILYQPGRDLSVMVGLATQEHHTNTGGLAQDMTSPNTFDNKSEAIATGEDHFRQYWATANYNFGPANLTYMPAYRTWYENSPSIVNGPAGLLLNQVLFQPTDRFITQEVRLASNPGSPLTWLLGGFYYDNKVHNINGVVANLSGNVVEESNIVKDTKDYGLFEDVSYPFADTWTLTEGLRFDYTDINGQEQYSAGSNPFGLGPGPNTVTTSSISGGEGIRIFRNMTFRARIEKQLTPSNNLYALISTGFLPGDAQATTTSIKTGPNAGQEVATVSTYNQERLIAYEIGSKNRFLSNRLQVNGDFFYYDYSGYQTNTNTSVANPGFQTLTSPARTYGPELEVTYLLTPADRIGLNYDYISAQYVNESAQFAEYVANKDIAGVPKNALTATYDHTLVLAGGSNLDFFGDVRYTTSYPAANILPASSYFVGGVQYGCPDNWESCAAYNKVGDQVIGDGHVTWTSSNGKYAVTGYIRNLANNTYKTGAALSGYGVSFSPTGTTYQPRLFGLVINGKF